MRYMMLIYNREAEFATPEDLKEISAAHRAVMDETTRQGMFRGADPLKPTSTATTVRVKNGNAVVTDGPFAETKEQLAGYYILDCKDLDEALEWAAKIHAACEGATCVEVRPVFEIRKPPQEFKTLDHAQS